LKGWRRRDRCWEEIYMHERKSVRIGRVGGGARTRTHTYIPMTTVKVPSQVIPAHESMQTELELPGPPQPAKALQPGRTLMASSVDVWSAKAAHARLARRIATTDNLTIAAFRC